ncbi:unnamed protein product, partial [Ascophyllum nodosum]
HQVSVCAEPAPSQARICVLCGSFQRIIPGIRFSKWGMSSLIHPQTFPVPQMKVCLLKLFDGSSVTVRAKDSISVAFFIARNAKLRCSRAALDHPSPLPPHLRCLTQ